MRMFILFTLLLGSFSAFAEFKNESELGYIQTGGNSQVATTNAKTTNWYDINKNNFRFGGHYIYGESSTAGVTARNWSANGRYEREVKPKLSLTIGEVIEGNRFTGIKTRYNSDIGIKYFYIKEDNETFFTELGYRYTIEDRYSPTENQYDNKGRFYNEYARKPSETFQYRIWLEVIPNFTVTEDYLVNGEASITSILNSVFSLKVAYLGMYDNKPATSSMKMYDYFITTSLVAKF